MDRWFKAGPLSSDQKNRVEDARRAAERELDVDVSNLELLDLLVTEVGPKWKPNEVVAAGVIPERVKRAPAGRKR